MLCLLTVYLSAGQVPNLQQSTVVGARPFESCVLGSVRHQLTGVIGDMFLRE